MTREDRTKGFCVGFDFSADAGPPCPPATPTRAAAEPRRTIQTPTSKITAPPPVHPTA